MMDRMPTTLPPATPLPVSLGERIAADIRQRGLRPGDRYLTAAEVGRLLGVSTMTANRAMQALADRGLLIRGRRTGTFIGDGFSVPTSVLPPCLHLMVYPEYYTVARDHLEHFVAGLHRTLPTHAIQYTFLPAEDDVGFVRDLIDSTTKAGTFGGAVLFASSLALQRYCAQQRVPVVVAGSVYPEACSLPWLDRDQCKIGRLLAGHALARGHRRLVVLMRDRWGSGDNLMIDGVHLALAGSKLGFGALTIRSLPPDPALVVGTLGDLLSRENGPTAFICRTRMAADAAAEAVRAAGHKVRRDMEVVLADAFGDASNVPYPHTRGVISEGDEGKILGTMLQALAAGERPKPDQHVIDVELVVPK
jgi:DNA-binding LacI/PurR family transcriptional regulator